MEKYIYLFQPCESLKMTEYIDLRHPAAAGLTLGTSVMEYRSTGVL
jgi:hypothetical protein